MSQNMFKRASWLDVTDYGVAPGSPDDCSAVVQKLCDDHPGATVYFPAGDYQVRNPILLGGCHLIGDGADESGLPTGDHPSGTTLWGVLRGRPVLVAGFTEGQRGKGPDGFSTSTTEWRVGPQHRPEIGHLGSDGTLRWPALATRGELVGVAVQNPATHGARYSSGYGHYATDEEFTLEFLVDGHFSPGDMLFGFYQHDPWALYVDGEGCFNFGLQTVDPADPWAPSTGQNLVAKDVPWGRDLRVRGSFRTGELSLWCGDRRLPATLQGDIRGRRFSPNRHSRPFMLGAAHLQIPMGSGGTDMVVGGLRWSNVLRDEPPSGRQVDRYTGLRTDGVVWYLDLSGSDFPPGRWVGLQGGPASDCHFGLMGLVHANLQLNGTIGGSVRGVRVVGGSPAVLIGQVLKYKIENCVIDTGDCGVATMGFGALYPIDLVECELGGTVNAMSATASWVRCSRVDVNYYGGHTAFAMTGSQLHFADRCFVSRIGGMNETVVSFARGSDGNRLSGSFLVDNEDHALSRAFAMVERGGNGFTSVDLWDVEVAAYGKGCAVVELLDGGGPPDQYGPALCSVRSSAFPAGGSAPLAARVRGDHWDVAFNAPWLRADVSGASSVSGVFREDAPDAAVDAAPPSLFRRAVSAASGLIAAVSRRPSKEGVQGS